MERDTSTEATPTRGTTQGGAQPVWESPSDAHPWERDDAALWRNVYSDRRLRPLWQLVKAVEGGAVRTFGDLVMWAEEMDHREAKHGGLPADPLLGVIAGNPEFFRALFDGRR